METALKLHWDRARTAEIAGNGLQPLSPAVRMAGTAGSGMKRESGIRQLIGCQIPPERKTKSLKKQGKSENLRTLTVTDGNASSA